MERQEENKAEWFSEWFDSRYYHILYQNHDFKEAQLFIERLAQHFQFSPGHKIMDLACGRGRHSLFLNQMGLDVVGLDLSPQSIAYARQFENERLHFFEHDMREVFDECCFDYIVNLFTSFGYFQSEQENLKAIQAAKENLKPQGKLIIDFLNPRKVIRELVAYAEILREDIRFEISKSYEEGFILKNIRFEDKGKAYSFTERVQAIHQETFEDYFKQSGLILSEVFGNYQLGPWDAENSDRMILVGTLE